MFCVLENEGKGVVEFLVRAEPDKLAFAHVDIRLEHISKGCAGLRIQPVRRNDQIVVAHIVLHWPGLGRKLDLHAQLNRAFLQQLQQLLAADAAEAVACRQSARAFVKNGDVVPIGEMFADRLGADGIVRR